MKKSKIDIILPVYREEDNIERAIKGISTHTKTSHRILAIWQDKNDPTVPVLKRLSKKYKNLTLLESKEGVGMLKALKTGFKHAKADIIMIMMSDLSDNPKDIEKMIAKIENGYDVVCASRYMKHGKRIGGSKMKAFLSWFACVTLKIITDIPTKDATNAYKCFRQTVLKNIAIESTAGFELPLELVVKAYRKGYKITDIPTIWKERDSGKSSFKIFSWIPYYMRWYIFAIKHNKYV